MAEDPIARLRRRQEAVPWHACSSCTAVAPRSTRCRACRRGRCSRRSPTTAHEVVPVGITRDGRWTLTDGRIAPVTDGRLPEVDGDRPDRRLVTGTDGPELVVFAADGSVTDRIPLDVAFPVLHGPGGEDGSVQGMLATVGLRYVGADVAASALGVDKAAMKGRFRLNGLPQVAHVALEIERWQREADLVREELARIPLPWFVKPARQGSSIGITRVDDVTELDAAIAEAARHDHRIVVEEGLTALRELEVGSSRRTAASRSPASGRSCRSTASTTSTRST
jgi:D-alanine-D-alanine ligase